MIPVEDFVIRHQDFVERTTSLMDCQQDEEDYVSCEECGALFDKVNNLAKHLQTDHVAKDAAVSGESANGAEMDAESVGEENLEQLAFANFYDKATETVQKSAEWEEKHKDCLMRIVGRRDRRMAMATLQTSESPYRAGYPTMMGSQHRRERHSSSAQTRPEQS